MGKYLSIDNDLNALFGSAVWKAEGVAIYPVAYEGEARPESYCRFSIVPSDDGIPGYSAMQRVSGLLMIEIYSPFGKGPKLLSTIADKLDKHLQGKTLGSTQFFRSTTGGIAKDRDNPALARAIYQIPFTHVGVG